MQVLKFQVILIVRFTGAVLWVPLPVLSVWYQYFAVYIIQFQFKHGGIFLRRECLFCFRPWALKKVARRPSACTHTNTQVRAYARTHIQWYTRKHSTCTRAHRHEGQIETHNIVNLKQTVITVSDFSSKLALNTTLKYQDSCSLI